MTSQEQTPSFGLSDDELNPIQPPPLTENQALEEKGLADVHVECQACHKTKTLRISTRGLTIGQMINVKANCNSCGSGINKNIPFEPVAYR